MRGHQEPFDIERALQIIQEAVRPFPKPAAYELADEGYRSPFEQIVACIISIREEDEVTLPTARAFFARARTPGRVCALAIEEIDQMLRYVGLRNEKSRWIKESASTIEHDYGGVVPCDYKKLLALGGVGPKCANVVLAVACGQPAIIVDRHVQRLVNAWGYVHTSRPEETLKALEAKLPKKDWAEFNRWLMPFDKYACSPEHRDSLKPDARALCPD